MAYLNGKKVLLPIQLTVENGTGGMSLETKNALLALFRHVAYATDNGQQYYDALESALFPPTDLVSISAVFTQGSTVIYESTSLDDLKQYLAVTAHYDDNTDEVVEDYTLSGTLTEGTSVITVLYSGKTTTFEVTVTESGSDMNGWKDGVAYDNLTVVNDSYVKAADGTFNSYNGWSRTGYIPCNGVDTLDFSVGYDTGQNDRLSNAFYDNEKTFISNFTVPRGVGTINVPTNAHYFALSCTTAQLNSCISGGITPNAQVVTE